MWAKFLYLGILFKNNIYRFVQHWFLSLGRYWNEFSM